MKFLLLSVTLYTLGIWLACQVAFRLFPLSTAEMRQQMQKRAFYTAHFPHVSWLWRFLYPRPHPITKRVAFWQLVLITLLLLGVVITGVLGLLLVS